MDARAVGNEVGLQRGGIFHAGEGASLRGGHGAPCRAVGLHHQPDLAARRLLDHCGERLPVDAQLRVRQLDGHAVGLGFANAVDGIGGQRHARHALVQAGQVDDHGAVRADLVQLGALDLLDLRRAAADACRNMHGVAAAADGDGNGRCTAALAAGRYGRELGNVARFRMRGVPLAGARLHALGARGGGRGDGPSAPVVAVGVKVAVGCATARADRLLGAIRRAAAVRAVAGFFRVLCHRTVCVFAIVPMVGVVVHPFAGPVVSRGTDGLRSRHGADGAGEGLFARGRTGGLCLYNAGVPVMRYLVCFVGHIAAGALLPVVIPVALPCAIFKVVAQLACGDHIFLRLRGKGRVLKACRISG